MKVCIITTYPSGGSRNIGDALITKCTKNFLIDVFGDHIQIDCVWRAQQWSDVSETIKAADLVVFACLAVRRFMTIKEYPYLSMIMNLNKKMVILAAGTNIPMGDGEIDFEKSISNESLSVLKELGDKAAIFTSRGYITHWFFKSNGIQKSEFTGDIAFYDPRFFNRSFKTTKRIERIAVSDPHYGDVYWPTMKCLLEKLGRLFPTATFEVLMHGVNPYIETQLRAMDVPIKKIYEDVDSGLDEYDDFDLHVGFRVHGHVSALSRRIPSYLLEQDGRGSEYGLTISRRISVPCHLIQPNRSFVSRIANLASGRKKNYVNTEAVEKLASLIFYDNEKCFAKFLGLEVELQGYVSNFLNLRKILVESN